MKAIILQGSKKVTFIHDRQPPTLRPAYLLVRTKAVALNPTDYKHVDLANTADHLLGCDYAGIVEQIGSDVVDGRWKIGDRICGFAHGGNSLQPEDGAFAEQIVVKASMQLKMPEYMSFEEAATLGVGITTVGQGLYQKMKLNLPTDPITTGETILIYGGSSATGVLGIQFAKL